jgi:quercetin dioxygenase-like cupin family protein
MGYKPSPRPTFERPTAILRDRAVRHTWGDEEAGFVEDWIYVSSGLLHAIVFGLPPGGAFRHSNAHRTIFAADEVLYVLQGTFVAANPETGEVYRLEPGESLFFRRDTWHHGFSYGGDDLRVLELFAPPPTTGSSGVYARTHAYLEESRYTDDTLLGRLPGAARGRQTMRVVRPADTTWRLEGDALVGLLASTEHLTAGTLRLLPGGSTGHASHAGDELLYVRAGRVAVRTGWQGLELTLELGPGDAAYLPAGAEHEVIGAGDAPADAVFGVAPSYLPPAEI